MIVSITILNLEETNYIKKYVNVDQDYFFDTTTSIYDTSLVTDFKSLKLQ